METKELFGGAASIAAPAAYRDVSDVRPVPDHQEVFADVDTDASLIVEMLEREDVSDADAVQHLLADLLEYEEAIVDPSTVFKFKLPVGIPGAVHDGVQPFVDCMGAVAAISKFKEAARNRVLVLATAVRLPSVDTDMLVTHNLPLYVSPQSTSGATASGALQARTPEEEAAYIQSSTASFMAWVSSLQVKDWALFGGEGEGEGEGE